MIEPYDLFLDNLDEPDDEHLPQFDFINEEDK